MSKKHTERENPIVDQIARLNQLEKLIPSNEDIGRYGLDGCEMENVRQLYKYYDMRDISPHIQLVVTVLRKRREEKPKKLLRFKDLFDFVVLMTEDEHGTVTRALLRVMRDEEVIRVNRHDRVSIKI